jgi:uncharacterized protein GlcG (DUF336 family)
MVEKKTVGLELAKKIAAVAEAEASKNKWNMAIAIVDDGGNLIYFGKMDKTQIGSIEVAMKKAKTAIYFKRATKTYEERVSAGNNAILSLPNVIPFEGGLPLVADEDFVGAVGISGGSAPQDGIVAKAAADYFLSLYGEK